MHASAHHGAATPQERISELKRRQVSGELSDAEKAELTKSEAKLGRLEAAMSSAEGGGTSIALDCT